MSLNMKLLFQFKSSFWFQTEVFTCIYLSLTKVETMEMTKYFNTVDDNNYASYDMDRPENVASN